MELTQEQIKQVALFLDFKKIDYVDVRHEVLDHIISSIEVQLDDDITFDEAFKKEKRYWHKDLKHIRSFLLGAAITRPKIVMDKSVGIAKYWLITQFLIGVIQPFFIIKDGILMDWSLENAFVLKTISFAMLCVTMFWYVKMKSLKTTYLFLFEKVIVLGLLPLLLVFVIPKVTFLYTTWMLFNMILGYKLFKSHQEIKLKCN